MKNLALTFALAFSLLGASAAHADSAKNSAVTMEVKTLSSVLHLSESQFVKLRTLDKVRQQELKEAQVVAQGERLESFISEINTRYEDGLLQLLNSTQQKQYISLKESLLSLNK